jgi:hypothetical protein
MARNISAVAFLVLALAAAVHALMLQLVTLATNDPHDYQLLLKSSLLWSTLSVVGAVAYRYLVRGHWRYVAYLPAAITAVACIGIARMWPYAFA